MNEQPYYDGEPRHITTCEDCKKDITNDESYAKVSDWWGLKKKDLCILCYQKWKRKNKRK